MNMLETDKQLRYPKRPITIYDIKMIGDVSFNQYHQFDFFASVSKGTYIRTIAHDFGTKINLPLPFIRT